jgi:transcriptional regulator with XRE-family HTH domain
MLANLKSALLLRGLRGYELAGKLGIPAPQLSEIIQGRRDPTPAIRRRSARILQAPEDWLFAEVEVPKAQPCRQGQAAEHGGAA